MAKDSRMLKSNHIYICGSGFKRILNFTQAMTTGIKTHTRTIFSAYLVSAAYVFSFYIIKLEYSYLQSGFPHFQTHIGFSWALTRVQNNTGKQSDSIHNLFLLPGH